MKDWLDQSNVQHYKLTPFFIYLVLVPVISVFLFSFTVLELLPEQTLNFTVFMLMLVYVLIQTVRFDIKYNYENFSAEMSLFTWLKYLSFPMFIKLYFLVIITTLISFFILLSPTSFEQLMEWTLGQDFEDEQPSLLNTTLILISTGLIVPIWEELFFRGILLRKLMIKHSTVTAIVLSSLCFAIIHFNFANIIFNFIVGCFFAYVYILKRNIWVPIIIHSVFNTVSRAWGFLYPETDNVIPEIPPASQLLTEIAIALFICLVFTLVILFIFISGYERIQRVLHIRS